MFSAVVRKRLVRVTTIMMVFIIITHVARANGYWFLPLAGLTDIVPIWIANSIWVDLLAVVFPISIVLIRGAEATDDFNQYVGRSAIRFVLTLLTMMTLIFGTASTILVGFGSIVGCLILIIVVLIIVLVLFTINKTTPTWVKYRIRQTYLSIRNYIWAEE